MNRKKKKVLKRRGHRVQGRGAMRKYRGRGNQGGVGLAGSKKHKKMWIMKYMPDHLGKRGFVHKNPTHVRALNLGDIERLIDSSKSDVILSELGYDKVIGRGSLSKPLTITAAAFSKKAMERIEKAGGKAITA